MATAAQRHNARQDRIWAKALALKQAAFKQDDHETPVLFRMSDGEVTAVFPCEGTGTAGALLGCYAHIGQHSACSLAWYWTTTAAEPEQYAALKRELEGAPYGYRLKVYKRMQRWMADRRRAA
jgi:hypothetical protein